MSIKQQFQEEGYYLAKGVFSKEEVSFLEEDFDRIVKQLIQSGENIDATWKGASIQQIKKSDQIIFHTHNVHQYSNRWLKAFLNPHFLEIASKIIGPDIVLHHSKLFQKPAAKGAPFPMHQDWSYFPTINDTMIASVIHISDATNEMGCFRVYPGSHRLGRLQESSGQTNQVSNIMRQYPIEKAMPVEARAGDVLFFHYFTLHGSMPNVSNKKRKTVLVQMYSGSDRVEEGNHHPDERLVLKGWNHFTTRTSAGQKK